MQTASILLILVDVRFPLIHYPPALEAYVKGLKDKKVILVLTKTDLVPRWLSEAWKTWFEEREGPDGASVVCMESYRETERSDLTQGALPALNPLAPRPLTLPLYSQVPNLASPPPPHHKPASPSSTPCAKPTTSCYNPHPPSPSTLIV